MHPKIPIRQKRSGRILGLHFFAFPICTRIPNAMATNSQREEAPKAARQAVYKLFSTE